MSNHLKNEISPYLLQHAENPVDWYPWCTEAFEKAKKEDKPVFLSIGYSTCHWCHVMAHESFENKAVAEILNRDFISIKVDREERPDIDSVYMSVCQAFTGNGGWPMSIFMNWDKKPFFAGTYFPVKRRYGMPGFGDLLDEIANQWKYDRKELLSSADQIIRHLKKAEPGHKEENSKNMPKRAVRIFVDNFDSKYGGFGEAPKFPTPHNLLFLTLYAALEKKDEEKEGNKDSGDILKMVEKTLTQMRKGGIFDQIGYGFSRYSTDKYFLAPHFEKMLYDNALLTAAYVSVYAITKKHFYLDTAEKTAQYVLREMTCEETSDGRGFYSAQDADSEGVEGKYYTFTLAEIEEVLGEERGKAFAGTFDISAEGNFEGVNIPNLLKSEDLNSDFSGEIQKLYDYRKKRSKLHLDDKILTSWNSMMIAALSMLSRVTQKEEYLKAATDGQMFIEKNLSEGLALYTGYRKGKCSGKAFLDDYAFYVTALMELYHATLNKEYLEKAKGFCDEAVKRFFDKEKGGFYLSGLGSTELFMNPKETYDGAIPSGNSLMAYNLVRLHQLTGREEYGRLAQKQIRFMSCHAQNYPAGYSMFMIASLLYDNPPEHIVVVPKRSSDLEKLPNRLSLLVNVVIEAQSGKYPLLNDRTTFYVCKGHTCYPPVNMLYGDLTSFPFPQ
ncbi:MAG: thioredoxin domain-containing protein [Lachnospiraceae bacterium]|nr:thioredoxin domain-containing protein [Lachnospiraceae bacterium]